MSVADFLDDLPDFEPHTPPPVASPPKAPRKRTRSKPKVKVANNVTIVASRFVCAYSGRVVVRAIIVAGQAFANFPCAAAWLEENVADATERNKILQTLCEKYEQTIDSVGRAPPRERLLDFGGDLTYAEWIGHLQFWDKLSETNGTSVEEYRASLTATGANTTTKRGKGANAKVIFEAGMYEIAYNKAAAGCRRVNAVDEKDTVSKRVTPVTAVRKINTFLNSNSELFVRKHIDKDGLHAVVLVGAEAAGVIDTKFSNNIATQVVGEKVYGPACIIFTRKLVQKI